MKRSAPPIVLELRTSRWLRSGLFLLVVLAAVAVGVAGLNLVVQILTWLGIGTTAVFAWRTAAAVNGARLRLLDDGRWSMLAPGAQEIIATLIDATVLGPLIAMSLRRQDASALHLALLPDSANADSLRALRVWLGDAHAFDPATED